MSKLDCGGNWIACPSYIGNSAGSVGPIFTCNYITEDALLAYGAENGTTFYIPEDCPGNPPLGPAFNMIPLTLNFGGARWRVI